MPGFDGTGPMGYGSRTGGGFGYCPPGTGPAPYQGAYPYYGVGRGVYPHYGVSRGVYPYYGVGRGGLPWGGGRGRVWGGGRGRGRRR